MAFPEKLPEKLPSMYTPTHSMNTGEETLFGLSDFKRTKIEQRDSQCGD